jgi:hypothetical protein
MPQSRWVIVFAKAPEPGRVKTRLAAQVGGQAATQIYRRMAERLWAMLLKTRQVEGYRLALAFDPPKAGPGMRAWLPDGDAYLPQATGNLGDRIAAAVDQTLDRGAQAITVVGTDCPGLSAFHLAQGFKACKNHPFALGPAEDGGFYALTLTRQAKSLLLRLPAVPWSNPLTAARLLEEATLLGLEGAMLPALRDLDTLEDLAFHRRNLPWIDGFSGPSPCPSGGW